MLAELTETPAGWVLSLRCDAATASALRSARIGEGPAALTVSIAPNLVPGEPFTVDTVLVSVDDSVGGTVATPR